MKKSFISKIYPKKLIKKTEDRINLLSDKDKVSTIMFLNVRLFGSITVFLLFIILSNHGYIYAPLFTAAYYVLVTEVVINDKIRKRKKKLEHEAIFFFEVLQLTLEGGKTLLQAIEITSENVDSEISEEFRKTLNEVKLGKSLIESLKAMKYRIPSSSINNTILNITESSIFGSNIIESLNNQLEYMRNKELMEVKGDIAKLPTKISVISVVFFIPLIILIILAPVLIDFLMK